MLQIQEKNCFYLFNFEGAHTDQVRFFSPDFWQAQHRILGSAKGRGTTWFIQSQDLFGVNTALRHYYRGGLFGKFNRDTYYFSTLEQTRSFAEFRLLERLYQAGLNVPKPIAAKVEKTGFCGYRADILTEKVENARDLTALLQQETLPKASWQAIGNMIRKMHDLGICHTDLNAHNILVQQQNNEQKVWLLDFDKCGEKSGNSWKQGNLERLKRSFLKEVERMGISFTDENWDWLMAGYGFPITM